MPLALALVIAFGPQTPEAQIRSRYQQWDTAYLAHDVKQLAGMLHPKFELITGSGRVVSRPNYTARLWRGELPEAYGTSVLRLTVSGNRATVWTLERSKMAGSSHSEHRYRDQWLLSRGHWMLVQSKTLGGR
ncbi:MAG: nuclear transport factor 2 family protein [Armatimonadetes bacterium]|nr:nuclear transport factor 2 family protein [Armatimonadota bacterium]